MVICDTEFLLNIRTVVSQNLFCPGKIMFSKLRELKRAIRYKLILTRYHSGTHPEVPKDLIGENAAMIFMPGRSRGTLVLRLLDGHGELAVRPGNLTRSGFLHKTENVHMWTEVDHSNFWQFDLRWNQWAAEKFDKMRAHAKIVSRHKITINPAIHYAAWKAKNGHPSLLDSEAFLLLGKNMKNVIVSSASFI